MSRGGRRPGLQVMRVPVFLGAKSPHRSKVARGPGEVTWPHSGLLSYGCYAGIWGRCHGFPLIPSNQIWARSRRRLFCAEPCMFILPPWAANSKGSGYSPGRPQGKQVRRHLCVVGDKDIGQCGQG